MPSMAGLWRVTLCGTVARPTMRCAHCLNIEIELKRSATSLIGLGQVACDNAMVSDKRPRRLRCEQRKSGYDDRRYGWLISEISTLMAL